MVSRYICEINDDIAEAIKNMKYDVSKYTDPKTRIAQLKATEELLKALLDLDDVPDADDDYRCPDDL